MKNAHVAFLELEVVYCEQGVGIGGVEYGLEVSLSGGPSAEFYGVEFHEVEDVVHVHIVEVHTDGVGRTLCGESVNLYVLLAVSYGEMVDLYLLAVVDDA